MIPRILQLPENESFFLFGPRATGKTTLLRNLAWFNRTLYINLLLGREENRFARDPDQLITIVKAMPNTTTHVVIDEIQKLPKLLDIVHELIETTDKKFVLTGSSARKLKHGGANLLAGRAFVYHLYPFSYLEVNGEIHLNDWLRWGMLPKIFDYSTAEKKQLFLEAYTNTYLKEEVWSEHFVRDLDPFRYFLQVAAQCNGKIINFSNIARDVGVSDQTVQKYFSILEDTLLGFFLQAFQHSFRKRLSQAPKFYFFDTGVTRTLAGQVTLPLMEGTSLYGDIFEHFIILQCVQLADYHHLNYRFSYLQTKDEAEIDLVVERPGLPPLFIEIKSSDNVRQDQITGLKKLATDFGACEAVCFSNDPYPKQYDNITVLPWNQGIQRYFVANLVW